tara:strand:- start:1295 stop:1954 length:660 start_codon:yes stop_codon:yes gene_type:complete
MDIIYTYPSVQIAGMGIGYMVLKYIFSDKKYNDSVHSFIHSATSTGLSIYCLSKITTNLFSYSALTDINSHLIEHPEAIKQISFNVYHSLGYFIGDTVYSLAIKDYRYLTHHIISIAGLLSIFSESHVGSYGLMLAEMGGVFHHIKRYERSVNNQYLRWVMILSYYLIFGYSRYLMLSNVMHFSFYATKPIDYFQILLTFPLVFQNLLWMRTNWRKQKF